MIFDAYYDDKITNPDKDDNDARWSVQAEATLSPSKKMLIYSGGPDSEPDTADVVTSWR